MAKLVADALTERHRVTVLAGRPSYAPTQYHPYYLRRRETKGNLTVERVGSTAYTRYLMRRRVTNYLSYLMLAIPRALTIKADIVLSMTDPPIAGVAGALVARLRRRPFVYHIQDLHPDMALAGEMLQPARWVDGWEKLHRWALKQATQIIVLGEDMRERIIAKGIDSDRMVIVRNGAPVPPQIVSSSHPMAQEIRRDFSFVVLHAGNLGYYGAWKTLIKASELLTDEQIGFIFVGQGAAKSELKKLAKGNNRVRFLPHRPVEDMPYVLAAGDIHLVTIRRGAEGVIVPSKLYPILAAGCPVLAVAPETSDVARIVSRSQSGVVADPDEPAAVATAIRTLSQDREMLEQMGQNARAIAPEFESKKQLERMIRLIEEIV
jgi:glycosyltransferase involved in cell wall biosynthesis